MTASHLTLVIPGLFESMARQNQVMPRYHALETLLAKSNKLPSRANTYQDYILKQYKTDLQTAECVAAVSRYADSGYLDDKIWMQLSPVFLNIDKDRLILQGQSMLSVSSHEADILVNELQNLYKDEGWRFENYHPERWYVSIDKLPDSMFHVYYDALGRSVEPFLPQGSDQTEWHRILNEMQMLLHASEVNQARTEKSQYPINSVWCWGAGKIPASVDSHWHTVYTDDVFCKGLSLLSLDPVFDLPEHVDGLKKNISSHIEVKQSDKVWHELVVMRQTEEDCLSLDFSHYTQRLSTLENNWFQPLLNGLKQGQYTSVTLIACDGYQYQIEKKHLRRFWKKRKSI